MTTPGIRKVLLLEGSSSQDLELRERFSRTGFKLAISGNEAEGLERLAAWRPEIVLISPSHPAGDFVEYCRQVRAIVPKARLVVTSQHGSERLLRDHPGLRALVDGVMVRPGLGGGTAAGPAPGQGAGPAVVSAPAPAEMGTEFQRQLEAKYLEVEEFKKRLSEVEKKGALALASEQLKCAELETKLDNLLRMKEDFEFRAQNEIEERTRENEELRRQHEDLEVRGRQLQAEQAALSAEFESVQIEKERLEESRHVWEAAESQKPQPAKPNEADAQRITALEQEQDRLRAQAEEAQAALQEAETRCADLEGKLAAAREAQAAETERAQEQSRRAATQARLAEEAERRCAQLETDCAKFEVRLVASEAVRVSVSAEAEAAIAEINARVEPLETELAAKRAALADAERRRDELGARVEEFERRLAEASDRSRGMSEERDRLRSLLLERESSLGAEAREWREKAENAAREIDRLRAVAAGGDQDRHRELLEQTETAARGLAERDRRVAALTDELAALEEKHRSESLRLDEQLREALEAAREARVQSERGESQLAEQRELAKAREGEAGRLLDAQRARTAEFEERVNEFERSAAEAAERVLQAQSALAEEREAAAARQIEADRLLDAERARAAQFEERLAVSPVQTSGAASPELLRIQELLEEVVTRARTDAVDHARREAELATRLQSALEERRLLQERYDRAGAEATERERRSAVLLQSAIDHGPSPWTERANLPALVPLEHDSGVSPGARPRRILLFTGIGLLALALAIVLGAVLLRRAGTAPAITPATAPKPARGQSTAAPSAGAVGPREVWDRWTRTDVSGGVLVQATLRNESELRSEIEAAQRSRGWSADEMRAELTRRQAMFHFDSVWYVTIYLKNLNPGYPGYLDDFASRFRLRDRAGREAPAFVPPGLERDLRVFTYGVGAKGEPIYEATISLGFFRESLAASPGYLQLVVSDIGTASRRVLTWELE